MKVFREVILRSKTLTDEEFIDTLKRFSEQVAGWTYLNDESAEYTAGVGGPSCMLQLDESRFGHAVALTKGMEGRYCVVNIAPREQGSLSMLEYNEVARRFAADLRGFVRKRQIPMSVSTTGEEEGLQEIIRSTKARQFFERYLHGHPTSYHPADVKRLDEFICAAFRYCRERIDTDRLERYLMSDLDWSNKDAEWCYRRIEAGLHILAIHSGL